MPASETESPITKLGPMAVGFNPERHKDTIERVAYFLYLKRRDSQDPFDVERRASLAPDKLALRDYWLAESIVNFGNKRILGIIDPENFPPIPVENQKPMVPIVVFDRSNFKVA